MRVASTIVRWMLAGCAGIAITQHDAVAFQNVGSDVILSGIPDVGSYAAVGGVRGYIIGSHTCNIGTETVEWIGNGPPALAMNAYRLHDNRLMQIGMSWAKTACCAANSPACGMPSCTGGNSTNLGVGCRDTYNAGWNAIQSRMGPRSMFNAFDGSFGTIPSGSFNSISRRLQIAETDMNSANYPGALFFVEGVYVSQRDAQDFNWLNNASYQRVNFAPTTYAMSLVAPFYAQKPAIYAWRDHGNGHGVPDLTVDIVNVDVPGEGRFLAASRVRDNGNGTWRYDYALFNLNSDRSGASLAIPAAPGIQVNSIGFHDVDYHSGEVYDNTNWSSSREPADVKWSSPQTFGENPNSNALRWGMMYNYWFTADRPPTQVQATLGIFKPGGDEEVQFMIQGPQPPPEPLCRGDIAPKGGDGSVGTQDLLELVNNWGPCHTPSNCPADIAPAGPPMGDGTVSVPDLLAIINNWGPCD